MALTEREELELLELEERERARLPAGAKTAMRLGRAFLQGPLSLVATGVGEAMESIDRGAEEAGGVATDVTGKVLPPEAAAAVGTAVRMAPSVLGAKVGQATGAPTMERGARWFMQQAVNPPGKALAGGPNSPAIKAIDTMLQNNIPATTAGSAMLRDRITALKNAVRAKIATSTEVVNRGHVEKEITKLLDEVSAKGAGYKADKAAVLKAWSDFKNHPLLQNASPEFLRGDEIPMQVADVVKRASQKAAEKAYGSLTPPSTSDAAQQAIARGLKQGMNAADPEVAVKNAKISEYLNALEVLEPRAAQFASRQVAQFAPMATTAEGAMVMLADRNPWIKSLVARVLYQGRNTIPGGAGAIAGASGPYSEKEGDRDAR